MSGRSPKAMGDVAVLVLEPHRDERFAILWEVAGSPLAACELAYPVTPIRMLELVVRRARRGRAIRAARGPPERLGAAAVG
ncbi:MAG: hypothetical protein QOC78_1210 [Solirubrobacteraceae bacterium]|jgi:hypothetical protein|nr:hypothetical protein [Solirubrobacteraceae bacterium]